MAEVKRFSGNTTITQGTGETALSLADILPVQPVSQGLAEDDNKITLADVKAFPYAVCSTAGATAAKTATMQNFKNSTANVGNVIKVKFTNANTADNITLTVAGRSGALKARGVQMMKGSIPAGSYIDVMWDGSAWIADTEIVESDSSAGYTKYWDGRNVHTSTYTVNLGNLIWYTSQYGLRYSSAFAGLVAKKIYTVNITGFTVLSDLVHPILTNDGKQIRFTTMIGNIDTAATVDLIVEYEM